MQLVYVRSPSILIALDDRLNIGMAWKARRRAARERCVKVVNTLHSTAHDVPELTNEYFRTDALGCVRLLWWIVLDRPSRSSKTNLYRLLDLFDDNPTDALNAALRIYAGTDAMAPGEAGYFCAQQWRHHPIEMSVIKALGTRQR